MVTYKILWADDEIDMLKPHILFLETKNCEITPVRSGDEALEILEQEKFDLVFLDENMPGITGLETLSIIKSKLPNQKIVMITKSEEEHIMEEAIGSKIADYLIKPLNPNQIFLCVKKLLQNNRIISEKTNFNYQQEFSKLSSQIDEELDFDQWAEVYKKIIFWELQIENSTDKSMLEILEVQKNEANEKFSQFIIKNYESWHSDPNIERPLLSNQVLKKKVFPHLENNNYESVILIVIDNLRYDQWEVIEPEVLNLFNMQSKEHYYSILPTATAYARNALFAGMMPSDIVAKMPQYWVFDHEKQLQNNYENELLKSNLEREQLDIKYSYHKIIYAKNGKSLAEKYKTLLHNPFNAIVFNFVDMLSHANTEMEMIKELAPNESAYRSLTKSWFNHSYLFEILQLLSKHKVKVIITTDHGTMRVKNPIKILGDKNTSTNLRYKTGRDLNFNPKIVYSTYKPEKLKLPKANLSSTYIFTLNEDFLLYPNNFNNFANQYRNSFQHGGISLQEMIVPLITLTSK